MKKAVCSGLFLFCFFSLCSSAAAAVALQASEDFLLKVPNRELALSAKATKAPQVLLEWMGQVFPLKVTGFLAGEDGEVICKLPPKLTAGIYRVEVHHNGT
jgi:hypothetical protein